MLSRINRLSRQKDFENIFNRGKAYQSNGLTIRLRTNSYPFSRFGLMVSAAVAKKAVVRNHLRRQLSEVIRHNLRDLKAGVDVVLIVKRALVGQSFKKIEQETVVLLRKAELFANH